MTISEPPGLIGWWPLHDGESSLSDRLGQAGGFVAGAVPHTQPPSERLEPSRSLSFARGAYAAIPDAPNVSTGDFSVCLWAKTSGYAGATAVLLDKRSEDSGLVRGWCVCLDSWQLGFQIADGNGSQLLLASSRLPTDGNWHHLALTIERHQATGGRWYINGQAVGSPFSVTAHPGSLSNQSPLTLGRRSDASGGDFQGELSDVRLYQRALTAEELYQVYVSIGADEPTAPLLVIPPPVVSPAALPVENGERLHWTEGVPLLELTPESPTAVQPQPSPAIDAAWTTSEKQAYEKARQSILNCSSTESTLYLQSYELRMLPPEIGQLHNLQILYLTETPLTQLPPEIGQLQKLQILDLSGTSLTQLPPEIGQLHNLQTLTLSRTSLTQLPPEIGQLHNLQTLTLSRTSLTQLPPEIGQLHNLQKLYLYNIPLTQLPPEIGQLQKLQILDLSGTPLTQLPPEIWQLHNLQELDLSGTSLTQLPPEIWQLHNLQELDLSGTSLTQLPPEIWQLHNLQELGLSSTPLTQLPPEIGQLQKLQTLDLSGTSLTQLPPEIGQLHNLQELTLGVRLTQLPPEIGQLHNLQELRLGDIPMQDLFPLVNHPNPALKVCCWEVRLPRQYWAHPSQWQAAWLLTETNAELRKIVIEKIGYERLCQELQATELDAWREYTLLKIDAKVDVEPIHLLKMTCPSTAHIHTLRVPPTLTAAHAAIRWANWDIDSEAFALET
jgi:Leucine-rich repeat (LRR) protein